VVKLNEIRQNELVVEPPRRFDAGLIFIGLIRTPRTSRLDCPLMSPEDASANSNITRDGTRAA
jgi:tRNA (adenine37-N6)-methyltransferase